MMEENGTVRKMTSDEAERFWEIVIAQMEKLELVDD